MEKCAVCGKQTDKCCSLCRKLFYCTPEHQEVHWHMHHKFNCQGKQQRQQQDFRIYGQSTYQTQDSAPPAQPSYEEQAKAFVELFQQRLVARKNILGKFLAARESSAPPMTHRELAKECQGLVELSKKVTRNYTPSMTEALQQGFGLLANVFVVKLDELLDVVLLGRCASISSDKRGHCPNLITPKNQLENNCRRPRQSLSSKQTQTILMSLLVCITATHLRRRSAK